MFEELNFFCGRKRWDVGGCWCLERERKTVDLRSCKTKVILSSSICLDQIVCDVQAWNLSVISLSWSCQGVEGSREKQDVRHLTWSLTYQPERRGERWETNSLSKTNIDTMLEYCIANLLQNEYRKNKDLSPFPTFAFLDFIFQPSTHSLQEVSPFHITFDVSQTFPTTFGLSLHLFSLLLSQSSTFDIWGSSFPTFPIEFTLFERVHLWSFPSIHSCV